ncbi:MAG: CotH kinase family protein [Eubacterium sp.]|nr:CotH kinase family protein [Eubacterium sp.]
MREGRDRFLYAFVILIFMTMAMVVFGIDSYAEENPDNGIPVIYITIDESQGTIDDMNNSENHSVSCYGTISIDVPEGFCYCDMPLVICKSLPETQMTIRGRGNSTWKDNKKPYKIKLDKKTDVLGLGENKHWVLIANAYDRTLMKDRMTGWLAQNIGMDFTPRGVPVDMVMKNTTGTYEKYLGSYYLSEQVRVGNNRVEIEELTEGDVNEDAITGGYLVQNGMQTAKNSPAYFKTESQEEWANHTPNFDPDDGGYENDTQKNYIRGYMQELENELISLDFEGADGKSYRDMMDMESAAKYWLINEVSKNADAYGTGSTYLYKYRNDSKMYWGPVWDFDYAWYYDMNYDRYTDVYHTWIIHMLLDKGEGGFVQEVKKQWPQVKSSLLQMTEDGGLIDQYYQETKLSQEKDLEIWPEDVQMGGKEFVPEEAKDSLKTWIRNRVNWLDENIDNLDNRMHKLTVKVDDEKYLYYPVPDGWSMLGYLKPPKKDGYIFKGWVYEDGSEVSSEDLCTEDITIEAKYLSKDGASVATDFILREDEVYISKENAFIYVPSYTAIPEDAENQTITWSTSDPSIVEMSEEGEAHILSSGDVVITGTLDSGVSKSVTLHIVDENVPAPDSVITDKEVYDLKVGDYDHIDVIRTPEKSTISEYNIVSDNNDVVTVDNNGVLRGIAPGSANISIETITYSSGSQPVICNTGCRVVVSAPEPEPGEIKVYKNIEGNDLSWFRGSGAEAVFVFKADQNDSDTFDHFIGIEIDDKEAAASDYVAEAGSVIIKLKPAFLEKLAVGKHKIEALFDDGEAKPAFFTVISNNEKKEDKTEDKKSNEWVDGQWYDVNGKTDYKYKGSWKLNSTGWWYEDESGWYPKNCWQKINGKWYYFLEDGYMDYSEYREGYWLGADGAWVEKYKGGHWAKNRTGWWYEDETNWYPAGQYLWINGVKYFFDIDGYWKSE